MTFRIDDLLMNVLPAGASERTDCAQASDDYGGTPSPCSGNSDECNCLACQISQCFAESANNEDTPPPRDEQFALLSRELERALAR